MSTTNASPKPSRLTAIPKHCGHLWQSLPKGKGAFSATSMGAASCACAAKLGLTCCPTWSMTLMLEQVIEHVISALSCPSDTTSLSTSSLQAPKYSCEFIPPQACPLRRRPWGECASFGWRWAWRECAAFGWRSQVSAHDMNVLLRTADAHCQRSTQGFTADSVIQVLRTPSATRCPKVPRLSLPHTWLQASRPCAAKLGFSCPSTWSSTLTLEQIIDHSIPSLSCRCDITPSTMDNNY
jgi:hypothetical protein